VISAIRVVSVSFNLFSWNENEFSILSPPRVDVSVNVFYIGRVTVCVTAAAGRRIVRHVPRRIEFFVQERVLRRVMAHNLVLTRLLRAERSHCQQATKAAPQHELAQNAQEPFS
jgi:hypothetical protein